MLVTQKKRQQLESGVLSINVQRRIKSLIKQAAWFLPGVNLSGVCDVVMAVWDGLVVTTALSDVLIKASVVCIAGVVFAVSVGVWLPGFSVVSDVLFVEGVMLAVDCEVWGGLELSVELLVVLVDVSWFQVVLENGVVFSVKSEVSVTKAAVLMWDTNSVSALGIIDEGRSRFVIVGVMLNLSVCTAHETARK